MNRKTRLPRVANHIPGRDGHAIDARRGASHGRRSRGVTARAVAVCAAQVPQIHIRSRSNWSVAINDLAARTSRRLPASSSDFGECRRLARTRDQRLGAHKKRRMRSVECGATNQEVSGSLLVRCDDLLVAV